MSVRRIVLSIVDRSGSVIDRGGWSRKLYRGGGSGGEGVAQLSCWIREGKAGPGGLGKWYRIDCLLPGTSRFPTLRGGYVRR